MSTRFVDLAWLAISDGKKLNAIDLSIKAPLFSKRGGGADFRKGNKNPPVSPFTKGGIKR
jgi:hypothetical protein